MAEYLSLRGVLTALVTPFSASGDRVDFESLDRLLEQQIQAGVLGAAVCGSTGEAATLTDDEYQAVLKFVQERAHGRLSLVAGISVSATQRASDMARFASEIGYDGLLVSSPPYNKPSQSGLLEHFRSIKRAAGLPIVAYNIPGRTGVSIAPATLGTLSREGTICGVKECSGSIDTAADILHAVTPECQVVSGDDSLTLAILAYGGAGVISGPANALPELTVKLVSAFHAGDIAAARAAQMELLPKIRTLFIESNPVPVKTLLALQGVIASPTVRLPLVPLMPSSLDRLKEVFEI